MAAKENQYMKPKGTFQETRVTYHESDEGEMLPSVDVKTHHISFIDTAEVAKWFSISEERAEKLKEEAFSNLQDYFWRRVNECLIKFSRKRREAFLNELRITNEGRSSGWVSVHNLPEAPWGKTLLAEWVNFEKAVDSMVEKLCSDNSTLEEIGGIIEAENQTQWIQERR